MPYCPKCDMEFVEGMTVCTDCGGPLMESKEAALAQRAGEQRREQEERLSRAEAEGTENQEQKSRKNALPPHTYVKKSQRCEDMHSSAVSFFLIGGVLAVLAAAVGTGLIRLPMATIPRFLFCGLLAVMAAGSLAIGASSRKSAALLKREADDEDQETEEILTWFLRTYDAAAMDQQLLLEDPELSGEELSLKRFELIQDYLVTGRDLPDQAYVDALCDMLYARLYENSQA